MVSERLAWAATVVAAPPGARVLEVGCGHGVLVSLLAERAREVVAVDRSATMTAAATTRNRDAVDAGRVRLQTARLTDADLDGARFDVVVSFNVRAFWTPPAPEWDVVRSVLAPDGRVFVCFSVMGPDTHRTVDAAVRELAGSRGFDVIGVHRGETAPTPSAALELRRR